MLNLRMQEKLKAREAIDVSKCEKTPEGDYILKEFTEGKDYCDGKKEHWIWSIGKHKVTGQIVASTSTKFYQNEDYECLWLR